MGRFTERLSWRRAVERSRLPNGVKLTLLKHSEAGRHQYHDDALNLHGLSRERLAYARGIAERNVRAHLRIAEAAGWLLVHRQGHRGQQAEFHYVTPWEPSRCDDCDGPYPTEQRRKGDA